MYIAVRITFSKFAYPTTPSSKTFLKKSLILVYLKIDHPNESPILSFLNLQSEESEIVKLGIVWGETKIIKLEI